MHDLLFVSSLHEATLHPGFFVRLGRKFLAEYHRTFLTSPHAIALIAERDERPVGFVVGTLDRGRHRRHLLHADRTRLAMAFGRGLVANPLLIAWFLRTRMLRYLRGSRQHTHVNSGDVGQGGSLRHMSVVEAERRTGIGAELVQRFVDAAAAMGTQELRLVARSDNVSACRLYRRLGWDELPSVADVDGHSWAPFAFPARAPRPTAVAARPNPVPLETKEH